MEKHLLIDCMMEKEFICRKMVEALEALADIKEKSEWMKEEFGERVVWVPEPSFKRALTTILRTFENDFANMGCLKFKKLADRFISARKRIEACLGEVASL